jgi:hypothetical protein
MRELYNSAIKEILEKLGGFPDVNLSSLPTYRTSKQAILRRLPKQHDLQMVPIKPAYLKNEQDGEDFNKSKVSAKFLDAKKQRKIYDVIN